MGAPLVCVAVAMLVDLRQTYRGKRTVPGVLLTSERADGDSLGALLRYAAWRPPWSLRIALRHVRLRRSLLYATAAVRYEPAGPADTEIGRGLPRVQRAGMERQGTGCSGGVRGP